MSRHQAAPLASLGDAFGDRGRRWPLMFYGRAA